MPIASLVICVGGFSIMLFAGFLLFKGRVYVDTQTQSVIHMEFQALKLKIKTQSPIFIMLLAGFTMAIVPLWLQYTIDLKCQPHMVSIKGDIETHGESVLLVVVAKPHYVIDQNSSGDFNQPLPLLPQETYRVHVLVRGTLIDDRSLNLVNNTFDVGVIRAEPHE